ncbi:uncharacterized protein LOC122504935 [Leptopilina heterotoma]|uniref:uncharacterized protein LOC122504935 n=1 Tax=Leptopilina heterotoma TaxID=63436 RepID=UPI001CA887FA|nr:uncharacterized protein LOC122504935 [Leptopilina heterotoma]
MDIWSVLQEDTVFIPDDLKLILKATKYDNFFALERFTQVDQKKIEHFMQNTLHEIIKKEDREKYYGIFKDHPEKFIFVGGLEQAIWEIVSTVKKLVAKNKRSKDSVSTSACSGSSSTSSPTVVNKATTEKETVHSLSDMKTILDRNVNNYVQENYAYHGLPQISSKVTVDCNGLHIALLNCPFPKCRKLTKIRRNGTRWNTSNFYKHISVHSTKQEVVEKLTITSNTLFVKTEENYLTDNNSETVTGDDGEEVDIKPNLTEFNW